MAAVIKEGNEIKLGADPEFIILHENDNTPVDIYGSWNGEAGNYSRDSGSRSTGELRPRPGSPREITENIRNIIRRIRNEYPRHRLVVGGGRELGKFIGGHIHFNIWNGPHQGGAPTEMVRALDYFLGRNLKSMPGGLRGGSMGDYGFDGDCRMKDHGFEYRTAPSFIVDPIFTEAVFAIAYRIAELALENSTILNVPAAGRASAAEYDVLVPSGSPFENYYRTQVSNFKDYMFGGFMLNMDDAFDRWLSPIPFEFKPGQVPLNVRVTKSEIARQLREAQAAAEAQAIRDRQEAALRLSQSIIGRQTRETPIRCLIRHSTRNNTTATELMTHSVIPEIVIHQGFNWEIQLNLLRNVRAGGPSWRRRRSVNFDSSIIYISNALKGKFKVPRAAGLRIKYVNVTNSMGAEVPAIITNRNDLTIAEIVTKILHNTKREARAQALASA